MEGVDSARAPAVTATDVDSSAPDEPSDEQQQGRTTPFDGWRLARAGIFIQMLHSGLVFNAFGRCSPPNSKPTSAGPTARSVVRSR